MAQMNASELGDDPWLELIGPQVVLDRVPAAVSVWDSDLRCRFANRAAVAFDRASARTRSVDGVTLSGWLHDEDAYAAYLPHAVAALGGRAQTFDAVFQDAHSGGRRHAHVRIDPVRHPSAGPSSEEEDAGEGDDAAAEPLGVQILAVAMAGDLGLQETRLAAAEGRGERRAMARIQASQQDLIRRLFGATLQLSALGQQHPRNNNRDSVLAVIDVLDLVIRDLRSLTLVD